MTGRIRFALLSTADFEEETFAAQIIGHLLSLPEFLRPKIFDAYEPLKRNVDSLDEIVGVLVNEGVERTGPRSGGVLLDLNGNIGYQIHWRKTERPGFSLVGGSLTFDAIGRDESKLNLWIDNVRSLVEIVGPAYGEVRSVSTTGTNHPFSLQVRLPDVPPVSIYGKEYIDFFGRHQIESAPFLETAKVGECYWLVAHRTVLEEVPSAKRSAIRSHLGADAFMADGRSKYKDGRAPTFDLSNSLCAD